MQVASENIIYSPEMIHAGMLLRMSYVHSRFGAEFMGLVVDPAPEFSGWSVLVGDSVYVLMYRGSQASPAWKLFNGDSLRQSSWIHDVDLVYGASDVA